MDWQRFGFVWINVRCGLNPVREVIDLVGIGAIFQFGLGHRQSISLFEGATTG